MRTLFTGVTTVVLIVLMAILVADSAWASEPFAIETFENSIVQRNGSPATEAGSHPFAMTTTIGFKHYETSFGPAPNADPKDVEVNLPAGLIVNPSATSARCTEIEIESTTGCPNAAAVGVAVANVNFFFHGEQFSGPVYNMVPPRGVPALLAVNIEGIGLIVHVVGRVRTGGDYGASATVSDIANKLPVYGTTLTLWGEPDNPLHDAERGRCLAERTAEEVAKEREEIEKRVAEGQSTAKDRCSALGESRLLLTLPSSCTGPLATTMSADSWQQPERAVPASAELPAVTDCEKLNFSPLLSVRPAEPEAASAEAPTGLEVKLTVPQEESPIGLTTSDLKEAVVQLPVGMEVSPSAANGLGTCPLLRGREPIKEEKERKNEVVGIDLESAQPANCPPESKLGSVEVVTPLLEQPLKGAVYLAQQGNLESDGSNPFNSLFALYLVAEGSGALIKLPGKIELNTANGQLAARFGKDPVTSLSTGTEQFLPQLPFSELRMHFFGGPRAPLVTPSSCGTYTTTSQLTPWDGNSAAEPDSSFAVAEGCGTRGFSPTLTAGTTNPQAGGFSDETVTIARNDGEQDLGGVTVTTPPGLLGMLSKVSLCQEPQASQGTCGEASNIGETIEAVGPGEDPYWVKGGRVYLTGPYNHEPFGLSIVVPTVAGPFTLTGNGGPGREIVRASIAVDPTTGALTVASDPLPTILEGVPLDIRTINVDINRSEFTFNPTNCKELHVTSSLTSTEGATATPSSRFQAANCAALPFKPSLLATTQGNASNIVNGASLDVKVTQQTGEAAIRSVHLELPKKLPARLHTLQKACTEATFNANPANCPVASAVGTAIAHTPVLPVPLEGPGYFVSHGGAQYPELVFVLQGDGVTIDLAGETHIGSKTKITSSTFGTVPDAPISSFEANLPEGPNSALAGLTPKGLCGSTSLSMPTTIVGQNGAEVRQTTKVAITDCPKKGHKKPGKAKGKGGKVSRRG